MLASAAGEPNENLFLFCLLSFSPWCEQSGWSQRLFSCGGFVKDLNLLQNRKLLANCFDVSTKTQTWSCAVKIQNPDQLRCGKMLFSLAIAHEQIAVVEFLGSFQTKCQIALPDINHKRNRFAQIDIFHACVITRNTGMRLQMRTKCLVWSRLQIVTLFPGVAIPDLFNVFLVCIKSQHLPLSDLFCFLRIQVVSLLDAFAYWDLLLQYCENHFHSFFADISGQPEHVHGGVTWGETADHRPQVALCTFFLTSEDRLYEGGTLRLHLAR